MRWSSSWSWALTSRILQYTLIPASIAHGQNLVTIFTAMFMHGGWEHILGNMLFLWVFGPEIEDVIGPGRYLAFYLLGGVAATLAQVVADPTSTVPILTPAEPLRRCWAASWSPFRGKKD